ncbi:WD repeat-containing protein 27 [Chytriomyces hyalinus]|nr:WD repeat-containing protein 27 [Chytriomyces hyalinus]
MSEWKVNLCESEPIETSSNGILTIASGFAVSSKEKNSRGIHVRKLNPDNDTTSEHADAFISLDEFQLDSPRVQVCQLFFNGDVDESAPVSYLAVGAVSFCGKAVVNSTLLHQPDSCTTRGKTGRSQPVISFSDCSNSSETPSSFFSSVSAEIKFYMAWTCPNIESSFIVASLSAEMPSSVQLRPSSNATIQFPKICISNTIQLHGHSGPVSALCFFSLNNASSNAIISASEDRSYKVWDLDSASCIFNSSILSAYPISHISLGPTMVLNFQQLMTLRAIFVLATDDAQLHFHEFRVMTNPKTLDYKFESRGLHVIRIHALFEGIPAAIFESQNFKTQPQQRTPKVVSSLPKWKSRSITDLSGGSKAPSDSISSVVSFSATHLAHFCGRKDSLTLSPPKKYASQPQRPQYLFVATQTGFVVLNPLSALDTPVFGRVLDPAGFLEVVGSSFEGPSFGTEGRFLFGMVKSVAKRDGMRLYQISPPSGRDEKLKSSRKDGLHNSSESNGHLWESAANPQGSRDEGSLGYELSDVVKGALLQHSTIKEDSPWAKRVHEDAMVTLAKMEIRTFEDVNAGKLDALLRDEDNVDARSGILNNLPANVIDGILDAVGAVGLGDAKPKLSFLAEVDPWPVTASTKHAPASASTLARKKSANSGQKGKADIMHQPITFRTKVKSSGYTSAPTATQLFRLPKIQPSSSNSVTASPKKSSSTSSSANTTRNSTADSSTNLPFTINPTSSTPAAIPFKTFTYPNTPTTLRFNSTGASIVVGTVCKAAFVNRISSTHPSPSSSYHGHTSSVTHVNWSTDDAYFVTSSAETACLWKDGVRDPLVTVPGLGMARFIGRDRFLVGVDLSDKRGGRISLCRWKVERGCSEDGGVRPGLNKSRVWGAGTIADVGGGVVCMDAVNGYMSSLVVVGGAGGRVVVVDMGRSGGGGIVAHCGGGVVKGLHSVHVSKYAAAGNVFLTSGTRGGLKLWDLRALERPAVHFVGHANRMGRVECCLSECGGFVVSGSEDAHAYLFDVKMGGGAVLRKIGGGIGGGGVVAGVDLFKTTLGLSGGEGKVSLYHL